MEPLASAMPSLTLVDAIIIDKRQSRSGLYSVECGAVRPLHSFNERKAGATLLARTDGLTTDQRTALAGQNIEVVYVREVPGVPGMCGIQVPESSYGKGEIFGTMVVPYIVLSAIEAQKIENLANRMPEPPEPEKRDARTNADSGQTACFAPYGGC